MAARSDWAQSKVALCVPGQLSAKLACVDSIAAGTGHSLAHKSDGVQCSQCALWYRCGIASAVHETSKASQSTLLLNSPFMPPAHWLANSWWNQLQLVAHLACSGMAALQWRHQVPHSAPGQHPVRRRYRLREQLV